MEVSVERPAALDVHKAQVTACVRIADEHGNREERVAEFATTVRGLLGLRDWLAAHRVQQVVMEATGVYWNAPWLILEDEFECMLVNARHVKQVPGRKTDVSDWGEIFGDDVVAAAMIDRLVHHAEILALKGDSYRLKAATSPARRPPEPPKRPDRSP